MFSDYLKQVKNRMNKDSLMKLFEKFQSNQYDLPLNKEQDTKFLVFLISLMSFLAILALTGTFALGGMTARWSEGLENKITVEIPIETQSGHLLSRDTLRKETEKVSKALENHPNVESHSVVDDREMLELISPWVGDNFNLQDIPLPSLISVDLKIMTPETLSTLSKDIRKISDYASIETHQDWLNDLITFATTLKSLALVIAVIVSLATISAIIAGIRTRFDIHRKDIELLHLIGASDDYIARQFQRHALILALRGSAIGTATGLVITLFVILFSGYSGTSLIPRIEITVLQFMGLLLVPVAACGIAAMASRITALRTLAQMP